MLTAPITGNPVSPDFIWKYSFTMFLLLSILVQTFNFKMHYSISALTGLPFNLTYKKCSKPNYYNYYNILWLSCKPYKVQYSCFSFSPMRKYYLVFLYWKACQYKKSAGYMYFYNLFFYCQSNVWFRERKKTDRLVYTVLKAISFCELFPNITVKDRVT